MIDRRRAARWLVVLVAALAVILGISNSALARTTSTDAGSFTYDAPAVTRVDARAFSDATLGGAQLGGERERHASPSRPAQGAATTPMTRNIATEAAGSGRQYSVAYETQLDSSVLGRSRSVHFNRANQALDEAMAADPAFASQMDSMIPGVQNSVGAAGGRQTPDGWTWHHAPSANTGGQTGVMQLVPTVQHTPGSVFWPTLHPNGVGGYSEWAITAGAPKN